MKTFMRVFAVLAMAFGLIAGSLGVALAGADLPGIETDGGDGAGGGNADAGGGNNSGTINQDNDQEQNQDGDQDQDVDQDNDNTLGQGSSLTGDAGGSVSTDCSANQPDVSLDVGTDDDDDDTTGETGDVNSGDDAADCTVGDSEVGDSSTGDSNQANAGEQDASNSNDQDFEQTGGNQSFAPSAELDQNAGNEANAGDGGDGGDAENSGSVSVSSSIVTTLVRILDSILSGGDTIIIVEEEDDDTGNGTMPPPALTPLEVFIAANPNCELGDGIRDIPEEDRDEDVVFSCDITGATPLPTGCAPGMEAGDPEVTCMVGEVDYECSTFSAMGMATLVCELAAP